MESSKDKLRKYEDKKQQIKTSTADQNITCTRSLSWSVSMASRLSGRILWANASSISNCNHLYCQVLLFVFFLSLSMKTFCQFALFALPQSKREHNKYGRSNGRWSIIEKSHTCSLDLLPWPAGSTGASGFFTFHIISVKYFYFLSKLSFFVNVRDHFESVHNTPLSLFEEETR